MERWLSRVDARTKRVFGYSTLTLFLAPFVAVIAAVIAPRPLPPRIDEASDLSLKAFFVPLLIILKLLGAVVDAVREPSYVDGMTALVSGMLLLPLLVALNAALWATFITVAFILIRRLCDRRTASREVQRATEAHDGVVRSGGICAASQRGRTGAP